MLRLSVNNVLTGFMFDPIPRITPPDMVIDGFPEFAFTTSDSDVEAQLRRLAVRIVASHKNNE